MESAQYLYMDINTMNNFFNWTMTYRRDSDFYRPYARIVQVRPVGMLLVNGDPREDVLIQTAAHPTGPELEEFIKKFGRENKHLAAGKHKQAAWFVSHCATQVTRRERFHHRTFHKHYSLYFVLIKLEVAELCIAAGQTGEVREANEEAGGRGRLRQVWQTEVLQG